MTTNTTSKDLMNTPALAHLMGAYFHQDFHDLYGGVWQTLDAFTSDSPEEAAQLPEEIALVLDTHESDDELEQYLDQLGCEYQPQEGQGGYRGWLSDIARRTSVTPA